jgi:hypothetical protein
MTIPTPFDIGEDYGVLRRRWYSRYFSVQTQHDSQIRRILNEGADDAEKRIKALAKNPTFSAGVRAAQVRLAKKETKTVLKDIFHEVYPVITKGQRAEAAAAVDALTATDRAYLQAAFKNTGDVAAFIQQQKVSAMLGVTHAINRVTLTKQPLSTRVYRSQSLANNWVDRIITSGIMRGDSAANIAYDVKQHILPTTPGGTSYAAMRLARTELNNAFHATSIQLAQDRPWIESMRWNLSATHEPSPHFEEICDVYSTQVWHVDNVPRKPHPQCFSGETLVSAKSVGAISKRRYKGRFIDVFTTEDTPHLSGTPNHPTLTKRGWIPLSELREGDYLAVDTFWDDPSCFSIPNHDYVKTSIEDIFKSFRMSVNMPTVTVPGSSEQFHGDGIIGENIDIIRADSFLQDGWNSNDISQISLDFSDVILSNLISSGALDLAFDSVSGSSNGLISIPSPHFTLVGSHIGSGLGVSSQSFSDSLKHIANLPLRTTHNLGSFFESQAHRIKFVRALRVNERPGGFHGDVYNLQTESNTYTAGGIIAHNCRCFVTPQLETFEVFQQHLLAGQYRDWVQNAA